MKKNLLCIVLCFCVLMSLLLAACTSAEPSAMGQATSNSIPGEEVNATESSSAPGAENPPKSEKYVPWNGEEDFNALYASASEEKQKELDALKEANEDYFFREREIKTIIGLLPDNTPRITLEQAKEIIQRHDAVLYGFGSEYVKGIANDFNAIHGYPDYVLSYSNQVSYIEYHLEGHSSNQSHTIILALSSGKVQYTNSKTGEREIIASFESYVDRKPPLEKEWTWNDWDKYYEMATPTQKEKLDTLKAEEPNTHRVQPRKVFIIMGILPEDTPRATLEQIKTIIEEMKHTTYESPRMRYLDFQKRMNEVCGYYDYDPVVNELLSAGIRYYLNDEGTERIWYRYNSCVEYYCAETGVKEVLVDFKALEP